jgi:hypothetical protein
MAKLVIRIATKKAAVKNADKQNRKFTGKKLRSLLLFQRTVKNKGRYRVIGHC